jgi:hypothetical protein
LWLAKRLRGVESGLRVALFRLPSVRYLLVIERPTSLDLPLQDWPHRLKVFALRHCRHSARIPLEFSWSDHIGRGESGLLHTSVAGVLLQALLSFRWISTSIIFMPPTLSTEATGLRLRCWSIRRRHLESLLSVRDVCKRIFYLLVTKTTSVNAEYHLWHTLPDWHIFKALLHVVHEGVITQPFQICMGRCLIERRQKAVTELFFERVNCIGMSFGWKVFHKFRNSDSTY